VQSINGKVIAMGKQHTAPADGPLINGRPALSIEECRAWARKAHTPALDDAAASKLTCDINYAALFRCQWAPEFEGQRKANQSMRRLRRIAESLAALRDELPRSLQESRTIKPDADLGPTEALLDLVQKHSPIIDRFFPVRGRPRSPAKNLEANLGKILSSVCKPQCVTMKARNTFVQLAMSWLMENPPSDAAIARNLRRRTQRI
jgi:hypothetical protein